VGSRGDLRRGPIKARRACSIRLQRRRRFDELNWQSRDVLQQAKSRGVKLGGAKLAEARKVAVERNVADADHHAANVLPVIPPLHPRIGQVQKDRGWAYHLPVEASCVCNSSKSRGRQLLPATSRVELGHAQRYPHRNTLPQYSVTQVYTCHSRWTNGKVCERCVVRRAALSVAIRVHVADRHILWSNWPR
jgi:hypothetical protein